LIKNYLYYSINAPFLQVAKIEFYVITKKLGKGEKKKNVLSKKRDEKGKMSLGERHFSSV